MKKLKKFEDYNSIRNAEYSDKVNKTFGNPQFEATEENFIKAMNFQKENGGVIQIADDSKELAIKYGYSIKNKIDQEVIDAINNFDVVNFVVCVDENEPPYVIGE